MLGASLLIVFGRLRRYDTGWTIDPNLTRPVMIALAIPAIALLTEGFFIEVPQLIPVGIFAIAFGFFFVWCPYRGTIGSFLAGLADVDRFTRLHYFGFTSMLILLGAAMVRGDPDKTLVGGLLAVGLCFHICSYVLNDVIDLDLDKKQPKRAKDPLVRGAISKEVALALALVQIPLAALLSFLLEASLWACLALGAGFALILVYNVWGKCCPFPPLTDLVQGLGWGSLVWYGALVARPDAPIDLILERTLPLFVYGTGFILLINGVHGGLRDLRTDRDNGMRTTALFLGARPASEGADEHDAASTGRVALFAFTVHTAMFLPAFAFLLRDPRRASRFFDDLAYPLAWIAVGLSFLLSNVVLWRVVKPIEPRRPSWVGWHLLVLLLPPLALYLISGVPKEVFKVIVLCTFFVPLALQERVIGSGIRLLYREQRVPVAPPLDASPAPSRA
jgi:4-hydroxybenzoate polyprenyltransferase